MLQYTIHAEPNAHQWHIELAFTHDNTPALLKLPNWVPGSYMIRDFSRHITTLTATCNHQPAVLKQLDKNTWQTDGQAGEWHIYYTVYAYDLSVRASYLDGERGFFDPACLFLSVAGHTEQPHRIHIPTLPENWSLATTLPAVGRLTFQAASYAELIDHPFELGNIEVLVFEAGGIPHRIALSGHYADFDRKRLLDDVRKICETQLNLFVETPPFQQYLFMLYVGDNVYGGLEHADCTALHSDRRALPAYGMGEANDAYIQLLGLFSHEYFHAWNVKSIKPKAFEPYDLDRENYTEMLWAFEGITSYYDDLILARSRVISDNQYLKLLSDTVSRVYGSSGCLKQTLAQSSFTAWNKYYKQDENSRNAIVSYYQKGTLVALCLDLIIRRESNHRHSLDCVMHHLYRHWLQRRCGIDEHEWIKLAEVITGMELRPFLQTAIFTTEPLPLASCLTYAGITLEWLRGNSHTAPNAAESDNVTDFGAAHKQQNDGAVLTYVANGGAAEAAGLNANDQIIAVNRFSCTDFAAQWNAVAAESAVQIHFFRHGVLHETTVQAALAERRLAKFTISDAAQLNLWLHPAPKD